MLPGLVVADDLTGACDTGHEFAARGYRTRVSLDPEGDPADADVFVVDTDTRYAPAGAAADAVSAAVEATPAETVYKKIDSTLRGNLGAEVEAALRAHVEVPTQAETAGEHTGGGFAVVAPASPATGRTTACGVHMVEGRLVTDTEPGGDPDTGPDSPHLPDCFADADLPVAHLGIETVAAGREAVADQLRDRDGKLRIVTADATDDGHLRAITRGADRVDEPAVYVGSAGLASHVPLSPPSDGTDSPATPPRSTDRTGVLGVAGSVAPQTLAALDALAESMLVVLDADAAVTDPGDAAVQTARQVREVLAVEDKAVLTAAADEAAVDRALEAGRRAGLTDRETRERVAEALAATAEIAVADAQPAGLFLTGGDTAVAVLQAIDAEAILLAGESVDAGVPLGTVEGGPADGMALVTKAGAFGDRETVVNCLDYVCRV